MVDVAAKTAVMGCVPTASDDVLNAALPPLRATVASTVDPSRNWREPVTQLTGATEAVKVTC